MKLGEGINQLVIQMVSVLGNIYGIVTFRKTGAPLEGVKISVDGITTYSNSSGAYRIENLALGTYNMTLEKEGYEKVEASEHFSTPPWFLFPLDFFAELLPVPIPDTRKRHYVMTPIPES